MNSLNLKKILKNTSSLVVPALGVAAVFQGSEVNAINGSTKVDVRSAPVVERSGGLAVNNSAAALKLFAETHSASISIDDKVRAHFTDKGLRLEFGTQKINHMTLTSKTDGTVISKDALLSLNSDLGNKALVVGNIVTPSGDIAKIEGKIHSNMNTVLSSDKNLVVTGDISAASLTVATGTRAQADANGRVTFQRLDDQKYTVVLGDDAIIQSAGAVNFISPAFAAGSAYIKGNLKTVAGAEAVDMYGDNLIKMSTANVNLMSAEELGTEITGMTGTIIVDSKQALEIVQSVVNRTGVSVAGNATVESTGDIVLGTGALVTQIEANLTSDTEIAVKGAKIRGVVEGEETTLKAPRVYVGGNWYGGGVNDAYFAALEAKGKTLSPEHKALILQKSKHFQEGENALSTILPSSIKIEAADKAVVWSDGVTITDASVLSNGGVVELSGANWVGTMEGARGAALQGKSDSKIMSLVSGAGLLLLDPKNIFVIQDFTAANFYGAAGGAYANAWDLTPVGALAVAAVGALPGGALGTAAGALAEVIAATDLAVLGNGQMLAGAGEVTVVAALGGLVTANTIANISEYMRVYSAAAKAAAAAVAGGAPGDGTAAMNAARANAEVKRYETANAAMAGELALARNLALVTGSAQYVAGGGVAANTNETLADVGLAPFTFADEANAALAVNAAIDAIKTSYVGTSGANGVQIHANALAGNLGITDQKAQDLGFINAADFTAKYLNGNAVANKQIAKAADANTFAAKVNSFEVGKALGGAAAAAAPGSWTLDFDSSALSTVILSAADINAQWGAAGAGDVALFATNDVVIAGDLQKQGNAGDLSIKAGRNVFIAGNIDLLTNSAGGGSLIIHAGADDVPNMAANNAPYGAAGTMSPERKIYMTRGATISGLANGVVDGGRISIVLKDNRKTTGAGTGALLAQAGNISLSNILGSGHAGVVTASTFIENLTGGHILSVADVSVTPGAVTVISGGGLANKQPIIFHTIGTGTVGTAANALRLTDGGNAAAERIVLSSGGAYYLVYDNGANAPLTVGQDLGNIAFDNLLKKLMPGELTNAGVWKDAAAGGAVRLGTLGKSTMFGILSGATGFIKTSGAAAISLPNYGANPSYWGGAIVAKSATADVKYDITLNSAQAISTGIADNVNAAIVGKQVALKGLTIGHHTDAQLFIPVWATEGVVATASDAEGIGLRSVPGQDLKVGILAGFTPLNFDILTGATAAALLPMYNVATTGNNGVIALLGLGKNALDVANAGNVFLTVVNDDANKLRAAVSSNNTGRVVIAGKKVSGDGIVTSTGQSDTYIYSHADDASVTLLATDPTSTVSARAHADDKNLSIKLLANATGGNNLGAMNVFVNTGFDENAFNRAGGAANITGISTKKGDISISGSKSLGAANAVNLTLGQSGADDVPVISAGSGNAAGENVVNLDIDGDLSITAANRSIIQGNQVYLKAATFGRGRVGPFTLGDHATAIGVALSGTEAKRNFGAKILGVEVPEVRQNAIKFYDSAATAASIGRGTLYIRNNADATKYGITVGGDTNKEHLYLGFGRILLEAQTEGTASNTPINVGNWGGVKLVSTLGAAATLADPIFHKDAKVGSVNIVAADYVFSAHDAGSVWTVEDRKINFAPTGGYGTLSTGVAGALQSGTGLHINVTGDIIVGGISLVGSGGKNWESYVSDAAGQLSFTSAAGAAIPDNGRNFTLSNVGVLNLSTVAVASPVDGKGTGKIILSHNLDDTLTVGDGANTKAILSPAAGVSYLDMFDATNTAQGRISLADNSNLIINSDASVGSNAGTGFDAVNAKLPTYGRLAIKVGATGAANAHIFGRVGKDGTPGEAYFVNHGAAGRNIVFGGAGPDTNGASYLNIGKGGTAEKAFANFTMVGADSKFVMLAGNNGDTAQVTFDDATKGHVASLSSAGRVEIESHLVTVANTNPNTKATISGKFILLDSATGIGIVGGELKLDQADGGYTSFRSAAGAVAITSAKPLNFGKDYADGDVVALHRDVLKPNADGVTLSLKTTGDNGHIMFSEDSNFTNLPAAGTIQTTGKGAMVSSVAGKKITTTGLFATNITGKGGINLAGDLITAGDATVRADEGNATLSGTATVGGAFGAEAAKGKVILGEKFASKGAGNFTVTANEKGTGGVQVLGLLTDTTSNLIFNATEGSVSFDEAKKDDIVITGGLGINQKGDFALNRNIKVGGNSGILSSDGSITTVGDKKLQFSANAQLALSAVKGTVGIATSPFAIDGETHDITLAGINTQSGFNVKLENAALVNTTAAVGNLFTATKDGHGVINTDGNVTLVTSGAGNFESFAIAKGDLSILSSGDASTFTGDVTSQLKASGKISLRAHTVTTPAGTLKSKAVDIQTVGDNAVVDLAVVHPALAATVKSLTIGTKDQDVSIASAVVDFVNLDTASFSGKAITGVNALTFANKAKVNVETSGDVTALFIAGAGADGISLTTKIGGKLVSTLTGKVNADFTLGTGDSVITSAGNNTDILTLTSDLTAKADESKLTLDMGALGVYKANKKSINATKLVLANASGDIATAAGNLQIASTRDAANVTNTGSLVLDADSALAHDFKLTQTGDLTFTDVGALTATAGQKITLNVSGGKVMAPDDATARVTTAGTFVFAGEMDANSVLKTSVGTFEAGEGLKRVVLNNAGTDLTVTTPKAVAGAYAEFRTGANTLTSVAEFKDADTVIFGADALKVVANDIVAAGAGTVDLSKLKNVRRVGLSTSKIAFKAGNKVQFDDEKLISVGATDADRDLASLVSGGKELILNGTDLLIADGVHDVTALNGLELRGNLTPEKDKTSSFKVKKFGVSHTGSDLTLVTETDSLVDASSSSALTIKNKSDVLTLSGGQSGSVNIETSGKFAAAKGMAPLKGSTVTLKMGAAFDVTNPLVIDGALTLEGGKATEVNLDLRNASTVSALDTVKKATWVGNVAALTDATTGSLDEVSYSFDDDAKDLTAFNVKGANKVKVSAVTDDATLTGDLSAPNGTDVKLFASNLDLSASIHESGKLTVAKNDKDESATSANIRFKVGKFLDVHAATGNLEGNNKEQDLKARGKFETSGRFTLKEGSAISEWTIPSMGDVDAAALDLVKDKVTVAGEVFEGKDKSNLRHVVSIFSDDKAREEFYDKSKADLIALGEGATLRDINNAIIAIEDDNEKNVATQIRGIDAAAKAVWLKASSMSKLAYTKLFKVLDSITTFGGVSAMPTPVVSKKAKAGEPVKVAAAAPKPVKAQQ